jgi:hypothetical protein
MFATMDLDAAAAATTAALAAKPAPAPAPAAKAKPTAAAAAKPAKQVKRPRTTKPSAAAKRPKTTTAAAAKRPKTTGDASAAKRPKVARTKSGAAAARPKPARAEKTKPAVHDPRPAALIAATAETSTAVLRMWTKATGMSVLEQKSNRSAVIECTRRPPPRDEVARRVQAAWDTLSEIQTLSLGKGKNALFLEVVRRNDALEEVANLAFQLAAHDRVPGGAVCGFRPSVPSNGDSFKRDEVGAYCGAPPDSKRELCHRCNQFVHRLGAGVAQILLSVYFLTPEGHDAGQVLEDLTDYLHWFACSATYLNRNWCFDQLRAWCDSIVERVVSPRAAVAERVAARLAMPGRATTLGRA